MFTSNPGWSASVCVSQAFSRAWSRLPAVRTETAKKSFYYNGSVVYNNYLVNKN